MPLLNSTLTKPERTNFDYDIINDYENINMDFQLCCNLLLLGLTLNNFLNVRKWCLQKQVKPYKLYCINSNALIVVLCIFFDFMHRN